MPDKFRKRGIDCMVQLVVGVIFHDMPEHVHMSAAGVVLISEAIAARYIVRVVLLKHPMLTFYSRPRPEHILAAVGQDLNCICCGARGARGLSWTCQGTTHVAG